MAASPNSKVTEARTRFTESHWEYLDDECYQSFVVISFPKSCREANASYRIDKSLIRF